MSHRFPKPLSVFFLAAACLGAGALTGCGDDDDDNPAAGSGEQRGKSGLAGVKAGQGGSNAAGSVGVGDAGSTGSGAAGVSGQGGVGQDGGQRQVGVGAPPPPSTCTSKVAADMLEKLSSIPQITKVSAGTTGAAGACAFVLEFDQPVDHQNPAGPHFKQRVRLMHRSTAAPTSFSTNGYNIGGGSGIGNDELSSILNGNRVHVEHRFFPPSQPTPPLWEHLTIEQSAADHHRIVRALRPLYTGKWISTGASKGGMTASYHHRFYPGDVDGTVAYVAPLSFSPADPRYTDFLDNVGTQACRDGIVALQREALGPARRANLVARMVQQGAASNSTYNFFGPDKLFEFVVTEVRFVFWQYGNISQCNSLPPPTASDATIFSFLDSVANFAGSYDDAALTFFAPYYYQAAVQLGAPEPTERHLDGLLQYPGQSVPVNYPPAGVLKVFDPDAMQDVSDWVKTQGQHFLFVYGQNDPWSAAAYDIGSAPDSYRFFAPNGNHGTDIGDLAPADRAVALSVLEAWTGVTPNSALITPEERLAWRLERRQGQPPRLP